MTTQEEMLRAIDFAREFMVRLCHEYKRIPRAVREEARGVLRHYPYDSQLMLRRIGRDDLRDE